MITHRRIAGGLAAALLSVTVASADLSPGHHTRAVPGWDDRDYEVYVPSGYVPGTPAPVLVALHGTAGNSASMASLTCPTGQTNDAQCLHNLADPEGVIVVYPNGTRDPSSLLDLRGWNAGGGTGGWACSGGYACEAGVDDVKYFGDLLDDLESVLAVDTARIYVAGISNGGAMAQRLACEAPERFAGIGAIASGNQFSAVAECAPSRALPVIVIVGKGDKLWPYEGGPSTVSGSCQPLVENEGNHYSPRLSIKAWAGRNGCAAEPPAVTSIRPYKIDPTSVKKKVFAACGQDVVAYVITKGGHTWPTGLQYLPKECIGKTSFQVSANRLLLDFFLEH